MRFRPITILIGRNSSGKSSIIKFLLMLQQSGPGYPQFLNPAGESVHLGAFQGLKNSLTRKHNLTFTITATGKFDPSFLRSIRLSNPTLSLDIADSLLKIDANVPYSISRHNGRADYYVLHRASGQTIRKVSSRTSDAPSLWGLRPPPEDIDIQTEPATTQDSETQKELLAYLQTAYSHIYDDIIVRYSREQITSLRHLPAVRYEPKRNIEYSPPPSDSVGTNGQYAMHHLQKFVDEDTEKYEFILPHLSSITSIESPHFKTSPDYLLRPFAKNKTTGADVHISDYGFGVSQCLPILVQGAIMEPETSLMVEQPEAQLHPTAQLEMGSYFADLWRQRKVGSIIETHSGNILLRLRRLIANGELSHEDISVAYFTTDDDTGKIPTVKNLDINEDGSIEPGLPMEFFGADVVEGLHMRAGQ